MDDAQVGWIAAIIIGGVAGWLAEQFTPDEQSTLMADMLATLGGFLLEKKEAADPTNPRRSSH